MKFNKNKIFKRLFLFAIFSIIFLFGVNFYVKKSSSKYIFKNKKNIPVVYTALVPGAKVYSSGGVSAIVYDRVVKAAELYKKKIVKRILVSGDHGSRYYDEVNTMKKHLVKLGVPERDIFLDHAGFNTYNSVIRAKKIFLVKDLVIITQRFHLSRAVYIARKNGLNAYGYICDRRKYTHKYLNKIREYLARVKSFFEVLLDVEPVFLGEQIPIIGSSKLSWD